ncbi:MAG: hypothetical protein M3Y31_11070 [Gemmatimonadota bacterium]|nr:hypothetical protein [Gemmatimonadota bacterium]
MHRTSRFHPLGLAALLALAATACSDSTSNNGPAPAEINKAGGDDQQAAAGSQVAEAPTVRVLDEDGLAVQGATVTFSVQTGGGTVTGATPKTSATGHASVGSWTLGVAGGVNQLTATVGDLEPVTFTATAQVASGTPANIQLYVGGGQTAQVSTPIPAPPAVRVTDAGGQPVQFATVTFSVEEGGGTATGLTKTTDAQGIARVGEWRLGAAPGLNTLRAAVAGLTPLDIDATGRALDAAGFNLSLRFISPVTPTQYDVFEDARVRWEEIIVGELSNLTVTNQPLCTGAPNATEQIDDVIIFINLVPIDGPGAVLGSAGPCAIRTSNGLPISGVMNFDTDDLENMETNGTLRDVVLHEMGHVIGIGSLWNVESPFRELLTDKGGAEPFFNGTGALAAFDASGGSVYTNPKVPVENTGGAGTRDSHWRESVLGNELMTGFISSAGNPLSAITVASLADMGFTVNAAAADGYTYGSSLRLHAGEILTPLEEAKLTSPITVFDESGRVTGTIER